MQTYGELLTVHEFAATLQITVACVRRWIMERKITVVKVGRLVRIPTSEIDRLITRGTRLANGVTQR